MALAELLKQAKPTNATAIAKFLIFLEKSILTLWRILSDWLLSHALKMSKRFMIELLWKLLVHFAALAILQIGARLIWG